MPTTAFTDTQASAGFFGCFDLTTDATKRNWARPETVWHGAITGTDCTITAGTNGTAPFWISVDGGAFVNPALTAQNNGLASVFTGLSDTAHTVQIVLDGGYGGNAWTYQSGAFLTVTGAAPAIAAIGVAWDYYNPSFPGIYAGSAIGTATILPVIASRGASAWSNGAGESAVLARGSDLYVFTDDAIAYFSVDGAAFTLVTLDNPSDTRRRWRHVASGLDTTAYHVYRIVTGYAQYEAALRDGAMGVMIAGTGAAFEALTGWGTIHQDGDSITEGIDATYNADLDLYRAILPYNFVGSDFGQAGYTTAQLDAGIATILSVSGVPKVVMLAIGRNDNYSTDWATHYTNCINQYLTAGVSLVICRGITPNDYALNPNIAALVAGLNNPKVVYIETNKYSGIQTGEGGTNGTHPTSIGYITQAAYQVRDLAPYLSSPPTTATLSQAASTGVLSVESWPFTVTLDQPAPPGTTVNLASTVGSDLFHATTGGSSVTSIPIPTGQTSATFLLVPKTTTGARSISITSAGLTIAGSPETYTATAPATDATGFAVLLPSSVPVNQATEAVVVLTGGSTLESSLVVTLTDANATIAGTVTITAGSTYGTTTYTPTTTGSHAVAVTHSGGNSGMANPSALTITASAISSTAATGYSVVIPTALTVNETTTAVVVLTGGTTLTAPLVVTLTDANATIGGTVTINSGSTFGTTTYSPTTTGSRVPTASHAGGNGGMTDPTVATITVAAAASSFPSTAPAGWLTTAAFAAGTTVPRVTLVDTATTLAGNTPQTGDAFARLGSAVVLPTTPPAGYGLFTLTGTVASSPTPSTSTFSATGLSIPVAELAGRFLNFQTGTGVAGATLQVGSATASGGVTTFVPPSETVWTVVPPAGATFIVLP